MKTRSALEEEIFLEGLSVPSTQRKEFVDSRCGNDSALVERVNALLRGYEENSDYLEKPPASVEVPASRLSDPRVSDHHAGDLVGPYRLVEPIGEGGCGMVFLAEQQTPVQRQVALKVIKLGMDTREFVARFEAERQTLALMDHSNIARVYDAGATSTGRPYLAMELVRGLPITRYCDEHRSTVAERLQLFVTICHAIQHAHQKGVIHRDLKPSNLIVGCEEGRPVPKVIDFGIAKALHQPAPEKCFTQGRLFVGTPAYTSPEQMIGSAEDVDTRSDVYSLGVVTYELLTGNQPFARDVWDKAGWEETRRLICDAEPPRPSVRVSELTAEVRAVVAERRATTAADLEATLRMDLDWIVMRCLEKDRKRRYETVNALAMDVQRYLRNEAVLARPPSRAYRSKKFVGRHRTAVLAAAVVMVSLVGGAITAGVLWTRERAARDRAELAERAESALRHQAERVQKEEARRATRAIIDLASERLAQGRTTEGLRHLAAAARRDPADPDVAPLLASVLTMRNFALPEAPVAAHPAATLGLEYSLDGSHLLSVWEDGTIGWVDLASGSVEKQSVPGPRLGYTRMPTNRYLLLYSPDGVIHSLDRETGRIAQEIRFNFDAMGCRAVDDTTDLFGTKLTSNMMMIGNAKTGETIGDPVPYDGFLGAGGKWILWSPSGTSEPTNTICFRRTEGDRREMTLSFPIKFSHGKLATNPEGTRMASVEREGPAGEYRLRIWSLPDGASVAQSGPLERGGYTFYSPDGRFIFWWGQGIAMFDAETAQLIARMPTAGTFVDETRYLFSNPGKSLATWGSEDVVELWDLTAAGRQIATLRHGGLLARVSFSRDGKFLMTGSENLVRVWNARTGELVAEPAVHLPGVAAIALAPSGDAVAVGTSKGAIYRFPLSVRVAQPLELTRAGELPAAFVPGTSTRVLWMGKKSARTIELNSGKDVLPEMRYPEPIRSASVRADGKVLVVQTKAGRWQVWSRSERGEIERVVQIPEPSFELGHAIFGASRDWVALSRADHLRVWRLQDGQPLSPPIKTAVNYNFARYASFSPDGARVAVGSNQGHARIWNVDTGMEVVDFGAQPTKLLRTTFSPDGRWIVSGSRFGEVQVWDAATGKPATKETKHLGYYGQGVFSPDSRLLAGFASERSLQFFDMTANATLIQTVEADGALRSGSFSSDNRHFVSGTIDGSAQIWDALTGIAVLEPLRHGPVRVVAVEFSPDGKFVRTETSPDGKIRFWSVPPMLRTGESTPAWLIDLAERCAGKQPSEDERTTTMMSRGEVADGLRERLLALDDRSPYGEWGRWFATEPSARTIAPGFSILPSEAEALARAGATIRPDDD